MRPGAFPAVLLLLFSSPVAAQEPDSGRISTHQAESEVHRWDVLKTHPSVPELHKGAERARQGDIRGAICSFQRAAPKRRAPAYFNLGVVYFETGRPEKALRYFRLSYQARKDSVCLDFLRNTERLLNEPRRQR